MNVFYGHKSRLITKHKIWPEVHFERTCSLLSPGLDTITTAVRAVGTRGFWSIHSEF